MTVTATETLEKGYTPLASDSTCEPFVVLHEDARCRVISYRIRPGEQTGWHRHELDYLVIFRSEGTLTSNFADGTSREIVYTPGKTIAVKAPVDHNAVNNGDTDIVGYEIEFMD